MTAGLVVLETQDFGAVARRLRMWVASPIETRTTALSRMLEGCAGMAGSDPGGMTWAASYDRAASRALQAAADAAVAVDNLAAMFAQTARNYATAEAASTAAERGLIESAIDELPRITRMYGLPVCLPPPAGGRSDGGPPGWGLIAGLVGHVWPNGHQDRLRSASAAWSASAAALQSGADETVSAAALAIEDRLPEAADMWRVCHSTAARLSALADVHRALGDSCEGLAHHLDEVHSAVEGELASLVEWTVGIELTGALLSIVTFGLAEGPTQAVEAARAGATAARVATLIERFSALARGLTAPLASVAERAAEASAQLRVLLDTKLTEAAVNTVQRYRTLRRSSDVGAIGRLGEEAAGFPEFIATTNQLEDKFKHAGAFGIAVPRGRRGFQVFRAVLADFIKKPTTIRIFGKLRGERAILNYDVDSRLVVVQTLDGEFWTAERMTEKQTRFVIERGVLGGN